MKKTPINPWDWQDQFGFSQGWEIQQPETVLEVSGQTPVDENGTVRHEDDFPAQVRLVFDNLQSVLQEAGADLPDVVKLGAYLTDPTHVEVYTRVQQEYFPDANPAQTLLVVEDLALPGLMVEVEATAYRADK